MSRPTLRPRRWLALLCALGAATAGSAPARAQDDGVFDRLFGNEPAAERTGKAADGLALPSLVADKRLIAETLPLHDLGAAGGSCVAILPLLDALEIAHDGASDGIALTLPAPLRRVTIPASALLPSPSGACLPLADLPRYLPLGLSHDTVAQRLVLTATAALPVLMRLEREERQARLRPETARAAYPLLPRPQAAAELWSADISAGLALTAQSRQIFATVQASGALFGMAGRIGLATTSDGRITPGITFSEARDTPDLLGPLNARSIALGDIAAPAQPLIADSLAGRGLVISSRAPWRVLVDTRN